MHPSCPHETHWPVLLLVFVVVLVGLDLLVAHDAAELGGRHSEQMAGSKTNRSTVADGDHGLVLPFDHGANLIQDYLKLSGALYINRMLNKLTLFIYDINPLTYGANFVVRK